MAVSGFTLVLSRGGAAIGFPQLRRQDSVGSEMTEANWRRWPLSPADISAYEQFLVRAEAHADKFADFFLNLATSSGQPVGRQQIEDARAITLGKLDHLAPVVVEFFDHVMRTTLPPQTNRLGYLLAFCARFTPTATSANIALLRANLEYIFVAGMFSHHILTTFPTRQHYRRASTLEIQKAWLTDLIAADFVLRTYNKEGDELPSAIANALYETEVNLMLRDMFHVGWWKRGRAKSYVCNLFWAGVLLALINDTRSKELTPP